MASASDHLRKEASEHRRLAAALLEAPDFDSSARKRALFIVMSVNATVYDALEKVMDEVSGQKFIRQMSEHSRRLEERSNAIRTAAAGAVNTGDWSGFDELIDTFTRGSGGPGVGGEDQAANEAGGGGKPD